MSGIAGILYSVRMRAAGSDGGHLCGAERLVTPDDLPESVQELLSRALNRGAAPDSIRLSIDRVPFDRICRIPCLPVTTVHAADAAQARTIAETYLVEAGIKPAAIAAAFDGLLNGLGPNGVSLRGAALMDAATGARLEPDSERGLRASHLDYAPEHRELISQTLVDGGLSHHRTYEALALASKVIWAGVLAELCWSDEPDYVAGYVATEAAGYARFPSFKPPGARGGRVWFVEDKTNIEAFVDRIERKCVVVEGPVKIV